jgi:hypothetical protein
VQAVSELCDSGRANPRPGIDYRERGFREPFRRFGRAKRAAKTEFKAAWEALKASTLPEQPAAAYQAMNIRDDDD